ncbi:hypothetical protein GCM10009680_49900 [Streptomyces yatensis]|uniref:Uncharacterized protein n=1 Tax=Streptomyces yatensis TaxID=155177 RepID=A0ABN2IE17_9ACTN
MVLRDMAWGGRVVGLRQHHMADRSSPGQERHFNYAVASGIWDSSGNPPREGPAT